MVEQNRQDKRLQADQVARENLPPGVKHVRTLRGHTSRIRRIVWSPDGRMLASPSADKTIRLWNAESGECLYTLKGHRSEVNCVAFDPESHLLASGGDDKKIMIWNLTNKQSTNILEGHTDPVDGIAWSGNGQHIASASIDGTIRLWHHSSPLQSKIIFEQEENIDSKHKSQVQVKLSVAWDSKSERIATASYNAAIWDPASGKQIRNLATDGGIYEVAWSPDPDSKWLAAASSLNTVIIWDAAIGNKVRVLEGHTGGVRSVAFSGDGQLLASSSEDGSTHLWSCNDWRTIASIQHSSHPTLGEGIAFHPHLPLLAVVATPPGLPPNRRATYIHIYELDTHTLLAQPATPSVTYTSAKVVLVGDSGVGKTGLGWRLAHSEFKEHASTHGQQFWLLNQLRTWRRDGAQCEAVLWDLAGQDDYRLIHALFLDDADLAIVLFDPARQDDPLSGVEFWLKQLKTATPDAAGTPIVLVAARSDRGTPRLTQEELEAFCKQRGINAYLPTSAKAGEGIENLIRHMQGLIPWDNKPATVTTETFKRIKDFVLDLKENRRQRKVILTPEELRQRLVKSDRKWSFSNDEMLTATGHLANHGYVTRLKSSRGEPRILLTPELLNNLAASFVLQARRNRRGLGSLEEELLLSGGYDFPELEKLADDEKDILVDSAAVLFLKHNVCFRETDPLNGRAYLVFPELINLKKPSIEDTDPIEDGVAYTVSGSVENVYASLVVLMGYTQTFTRTNQWRNQARYEVGQGLVCGFRQEEERAGELDLVLYFSTRTPDPVRTLFQGLVESFLARRNLTVRRFEPAVCSKGHAINRGVVREQIAEEADFAFCSKCGERITLAKADKPIQMTKYQAAEVEANRRAADQRTRFEQALFRLKTYASEQNIIASECFISYAWGNPDHERWVEKLLATDLQKAGVVVVLDRWENTRIGASVPRFVERIGKSGRIIVVGTPLYRKKYDNNEPMRAYVVAAEGDLIGKRMIGTESDKESVLPVLLEGTEMSAFPHLLHGRVYADFRKKEAYSDTAIELLLTLYGIKPTEQVATELRTLLNSPTGGN